MPETRARLRGPWGLLLVIGPFVAFIVAEIVALIWVATQIGWWTLALLAASTILGAVLLQREWRKAWGGLQESLRTGTLPPGRTADAALVLLGGVLLIMPGFLTDLIGLLLLLPFTRPLVRAVISWWAGRALHVGPVDPQQGGIIKGEVITEDSEDPEDPSGGTVIPELPER